METWWERRWFLALLIVLTAVPLLWPAIPPFLDLPGHMGRYAIAIGADDPGYLSRYYGYDWALVGNLGADLAIVPLGSLIGVEPAAKLVVLLIPVIMAAGFLWSGREVHGHLPATAPLALVFTYAYPLHYGFVNYVFAMALVALAFPLWIRMASGPALRRAILFALIAAAVWIAHAVAWAALVVLCLGFELQRQFRNGGSKGGALVSVALAMVPLGTGALLTLLSMGSGPGEIGEFFRPGALAKAFVSLNRDRWIVVDLATSVAMLTILGLATIRRAGLQLAPQLAWPALALFALFIVMPDAISGSAFLKTRLLPWAVAYALLAIDVTAYRAKWAALSAGLLTLRLAATTASLLQYDASYTSALRALDFVPQGSRIVTFTANTCWPTLANWGNSRRQHLGGMAIVRKQAFVNDQFENSSLQLLRVRYAAAGIFRHAPSEVVSLNGCPGGYLPRLEATVDQVTPAAFDYVWLLDVPKPAWPRRPWLRPVYSDGATALYAVARPQP